MGTNVADAPKTGSAYFGRPCLFFVQGNWAKSERREKPALQFLRSVAQATRSPACAELTQWAGSQPL